MALGGISGIFGNFASKANGGGFGGGFGSGFGGGAGRRNDNVFDMSNNFSQSNASNYFSVEPFLQSLAANPSLGKSTKTMSPSELAMANQFLNANTGGAPAGIDLSGISTDDESAKNTDGADQAGETVAPAADETEATAPAADADTAEGTEDADAEPVEKKPDTPTTRLMKAMMSGDSEIKITRGDLTQALALGDDVENPDEELTLSSQDAMMLFQSSPVSQLLGGMSAQMGGSDPLNGLASLMGGGASGMAALMSGGNSSGGNILSTLAAALTGGGDKLASLLGGADNSQALAALASSMTEGGTKAGPSIADIFDLPTLGKADSIAKLAKLGQSDEEA